MWGAQAECTSCTLCSDWGHQAHALLCLKGVTAAIISTEGVLLKGNVDTLLSAAPTQAGDSRVDVQESFYGGLHDRNASGLQGAYVLKGSRQQRALSCLGPSPSA